MPHNSDLHTMSRQALRQELLDLQRKARARLEELGDRDPRHMGLYQSSVDADAALDDAVRDTVMAYRTALYEASPEFDQTVAMLDETIAPEPQPARPAVPRPPAIRPNVPNPHLNRTANGEDRDRRHEDHPAGGQDREVHQGRPGPAAPRPAVQPPGPAHPAQGTPPAAGPRAGGLAALWQGRAPNPAPERPEPAVQPRQARPQPQPEAPLCYERNGVLFTPSTAQLPGQRVQSRPSPCDPSDHDLPW